MIDKKGFGRNLLIFCLIAVSIIFSLVIIVNLPFVLSNPQPLNATANPSYVGDAITLNVSKVFSGITYVNFSANWTSNNVSLSSFIFSINANGSFLNSSAYTFGSTGASGNVSSNATLITAASGTNVTFQFVVNDSSGIFNSTLVQSFLVQNYPNPVANSNVKNNTAVVPNMYVNFSANWTEPGWSLSSFIFSIEQTGTWVNSSAYTFGSTGVSGNVSSNITFITAAIGTRVYWQFIVNDSNNNFNSTAVQSFIVSGGGPQLNIVFNNTPTLNIGNNSQIYNFTIIVNNTGVMNASIPINVTLLIPNGISPNNAGLDCDLGFTVTNRTTSTCIFNVTAGSSGIHTGASPANFTFYRAFRANHTAYNNYTSQTWTAQGRCFNCSSGNAVNATSTASITGNPFWINPRPYLFTYGAVYNSTLVFDEWGQIRPYYEVWAPLMTYNSTAGRPGPANNSFAEIIYADKPFFSNPTYIELWGYRLNFTIYFNNTNSEGNTTYDVYTPFINTGNQTLIPMIVFNATVVKQSGNTTTSYAFPTVSGFTVRYQNNSGPVQEFTETSLIGNYSVNVSYNTLYGRTKASDGTLDMRLLTVTAPSNRGNVTISLLFSLTTNATAATTTSPVYVTEQVYAGFDPDDAPAAPTGNINMTSFLQLINPLSNYTLTDLRLKFLVPMSVNITNLTTFANASYSITPEAGLNVTWRSNGSNWQGGRNVFIATQNFSFVDNTASSATNNYNITVFFRFYEINLTHVNFSNWDPTSQTSLGLNKSTVSNITANMTARMFFPIINKTFISPSNCVSGDKYSYNLTFNMAQQGAFNLTDELGSCFNPDKENIDIRLDNVVLNESGNRTIGSLILHSVPQGIHSVSVSYSVKTTASGGSTGSGTSTGGDAAGAATTTQEKIAAQTQTIIFEKISPDAASVFNPDPTKFEDITKILISVFNSVTGASFTLTKVPELPSSIQAPNSKVFKYYSINKEGIQDNNIKSLTIEFSVTKEFLTSNNLNTDSIRLFRFTDKWTELPTEKVNEDNNKVNYKATSPGASYFAIAAAAESAPTPEEATQPEISPVAYKAPQRTILWIIVVIVVIVIVGFLLMKKKRKE